jgi:hypothetical protein
MGQSVKGASYVAASRCLRSLSSLSLYVCLCACAVGGAASGLLGVYRCIGVLACVLCIGVQMAVCGYPPPLPLPLPLSLSLLPPSPLSVGPLLHPMGGKIGGLLIVFRAAVGT